MNGYNYLRVLLDIYKMIISTFIMVLGMPIEMYGEREQSGLQVCRCTVLYIYIYIYDLSSEECVSVCS